LLDEVFALSRQHKNRKFFPPLAGHHPTLADEVLGLQGDKVLPQSLRLLGVAISSEIRNRNGAEFPNFGYQLPRC
jgi:hypothetical protein